MPQCANLDPSFIPVINTPLRDQARLNAIHAGSCDKASGTVSIRDEKSTNGTFVSRIKIAPNISVSSTHCLVARLMCAASKVPLPVGTEIMLGGGKSELPVGSKTSYAGHIAACTFVLESAG